MSSKVKAVPVSVLKSFADIPRDSVLTVDVRWTAWEPRAKTIDILGEATRTLAEWLDARLADLVRERVPLEEVVIRHHGGRTVIYARGAARFEFKLKISYGNARDE